MQERSKDENTREIKGGEEGGKQGKERAEAGEAGAGGKQ